MLFSERMKIDKEFKQWCVGNGVKYCIASFLVYASAENNTPIIITTDLEVVKEMFKQYENIIKHKQEQIDELKAQ